MFKVFQHSSNIAVAFFAVNVFGGVFGSPYVDEGVGSEGVIGRTEERDASHQGATS
jgi:hypothetical protein